jgi:hypothetical protein
MAYNYDYNPFNSYNKQQNFNRKNFVATQGYINRGAVPQSAQQFSVGKKHSGCKGGQDKKGRSYVSGWKYSRRAGLVSFFAAPYKGTNSHKSENGRTWENWIVKIQNKSTMTESITTCLFDRSTGKVIIQKLGFVMNPKGGKGGYVGTYINQ